MSTTGQLVFCIWCTGRGWFHGRQGSDVTPTFRPCGACSGQGVVLLDDAVPARPAVFQEETPPSP